jgi:hypothetical protein
MDVFKSDMYGLPLMAALGLSSQSVLVKQMQQVQKAQQVRRARQAQQAQQVLQAQQAQQVLQAQQALQELDALSLQVAEACEACELDDWLVWEGNDFLRVAEDDDLTVVVEDDDLTAAPLQRYSVVDGARYAVLTSSGMMQQRRRRVCQEGGGGKCDQLARDSKTKRCRKHGGGVTCARRACSRLAAWDSASLKFTEFCSAHGGGCGA